MSTPYRGGCACGAVRYEIAAEPVGTNDCQCRHCQQRSGTGHSSYMAFAGRSAVDLSGEAKSWDIAGDSGAIKHHWFCPTCGAPVYLTLAAAPDLFIIHPASLDEPERYAPQIVTYAIRGLPWDRRDPALPAFDRMPPR